VSNSYLVGRFTLGLPPGTGSAPAPVNGSVTLQYPELLQVGSAPGTPVPVAPVRLSIVDGVLVGPDGVPSTTAPIPVQATDDPLLARTGDIFAQLDIVFEGGSEPVQASLALPGDTVVDIATAARAGAQGEVFVSALTPDELADLRGTLDDGDGPQAARAVAGTAAAQGAHVEGRFGQPAVLVPERDLSHAAVVAGIVADTMRDPGAYHVRTDAIAAASTGLPIARAGLLQVASTAATRVNPLRNPGPRSSSLTGWGFQSGTGETAAQGWVSAPDDGPEGRSGFVRQTVSTAKTGGSSGAYYQSAVGEVVGDEGDLRTLSMWVRFRQAVRAQLSGRLRTGAAPTSNGTGPVTDIPANTWTRLSVTVLAAGAYDGVQAWVAVEAASVIPVGGVYDSADAMAELSATLGPYIDGSLPATPTQVFSWDGSPNASSSTSTGIAVQTYTATATGRQYTRTSVRGTWTAWLEILTAPPSRKHAVFLGSSNVTPGQWTTQLCSGLGLVEHNYAVGGAAYHPSADSFSVQADRAAADLSYDHDEVQLVFVADASNDVRARVDTMAVQSAVVYGKLRATFPKARIIVLPVLWPSSPAAFAQQVPGGYQVDWHEWLHKDVDAMRTSARVAGCEVIEDSWTWHTGRDEWMKPGEVHFNSLGVAQTVQRVRMYLRGEPTASRTSWTPVPPRAPQYTTAPGGGIRPLSVRRDGWHVSLDGGVRTTSATGTAWDWFIVPAGHRPTYSVEVLGRIIGGTTAIPIEIFPDGTGRVHTSDLPAGTLLLVSGKWEVG
jgi:hypothetical protein